MGPGRLCAELADTGLDGQRRRCVGRDGRGGTPTTSGRRGAPRPGRDRGAPFRKPVRSGRGDGCARVCRGPRALTELARVLRAGGLAVVSYPNPNALYGIWKTTRVVPVDPRGEAASPASAALDAPRQRHDRAREFRSAARRCRPPRWRGRAHELSRAADPARLPTPHLDSPDRREGSRGAARSSRACSRHRSSTPPANAHSGPRSSSPSFPLKSRSRLAFFLRTLLKHVPSPGESQRAVERRQDVSLGCGRDREHDN